MTVIRAATHSALCNTTDRGYKYNYKTGSCYKYHDKDMASWGAARDTCAGEGGYLAVAGDQREAKVIDLIMLRDHLYASVQLGLYKDADGNWLTVHGDPMELVFHQWDTEEYRFPSQEDQKCVSMYSITGRLHKHSCDSERSFICEKDAVDWRTL
ncbi:macrophage mannose receptor 1-like isoform X2 [Anticarsia gemmatalis]